MGAFFLFTQPLTAQNLLELLPGSDKLIVDNTLGYQKLVGNVRFKYQGHLMYCDSALFYDKKGEVFAYGKVHINKQDTLNLYCDSLYYNSKTRLAKLWGNVRVRDREYKLETDTLDYDAKIGAAIYRHGGKITHIRRNDKLTSKVGYYYPDSKNFFFRKDVVYNDDRYHVTTDTMKFQSLSELLFFYGPTEIYQKEEKRTIQCNRGVFDMKKNEGEFIDRAAILEPGKSVFGDTLRYFSESQRSIGLGNVRVRDSVENIEFRGGYAVSDGNERSHFLTKKPLAILFQSEDTTYIQADTLYSISDTLNSMEFMRAHHQVRIFSTKYQGICDSLAYTQSDSLMKLYRNPVLWTENNQLTGEFMQIKREKDHIRHAKILGKALAVSEVDSGQFYNQVAGRDMDGYFTQGKLTLVHVQGNARTIYFPEEEKENDTAKIVTRNGMNRLYSSEMKLYLDSGEVRGLTSIEQPDGAFYSLDKIPEKERKVDQFIWRPADRPRRPEEDF
jgi:lipopolysaccharide export system protein LptA